MYLPQPRLTVVGDWASAAYPICPLLSAAEADIVYEPSLIVPVPLMEKVRGPLPPVSVREKFSGGK